MEDHCSAAPAAVVRSWGPGALKEGFQLRRLLLDGVVRKRLVPDHDQRYGDGPAPVWTNSVWTEESYGDCIRVNADYVTIQNIKFYHTPACPYPPPPYDPVDPEGWGVWEMGAINTYPGTDYVTVQYCEFEDCVAGIRSRGQ